jgi:YebC/PmpR family DNA-binding regulatory protein
MAKHSHWAKIKYKKAIADKAKGQIFSKLVREIVIAVREKGADPNFNPRLRLAIEKAKSYRLPAENIERAIKRGAGLSQEDKENLEEIVIEAFGPSGLAIIIEAITDNKNRTINEVKQILAKYKAKMVPEGSAKWLFERKINEETKSLEWVAKNEIDLDEKTRKEIEALFEELDNNEDVQEIYSNLKNKEDVL